MTAADAPPLVLPVLGVPVRFEVADPALRDAVEAAYGAWRGVRADDVAREPRIRLRTSGGGGLAGGEGRGGGEDGGAHARDGGGGTDAASAAVRTHAGGARLTIDRPGVAARASLDAMRAAARIAPGVVADPAAVREILDTLTLFLVTRLDRQPVHAAAIAAGGTALVLTGPSGAGKSTLAYAAHAAGLRVLSDDAVYVQIEPRLRLWGTGRPIHLDPRAAEWFPELAGRPVVPRPHGRRKAAVDAPAAAPPVAERAALCLLARGPGPPRAEALPPGEAVEAVASTLEPGFDAFEGTIRPRLEALAAGGAWRVVTGARPHDALPVLLELLDRARSPGA